MTVKEDFKNPIQVTNTTAYAVIVLGLIAGLIMIIAYKYSQKRRQKYIKCDELLQENQDFGGTFPFVVSNEDEDSEDEELLNEID